MVAQFQREYPGTFIEMRVCSSRQIASWVTSRQVDIGLIDAPVPVAGLSAQLFRMKCVCILRQDDPLAVHDVITPDLLLTRPVIGVTGDHPVDRQLDQVMAQAEAPLRRSASSYFYAIARNLVSAGDGVSIVDPVNGKAALSDGVVWRPFTPAIYHEPVMITSRDHPLGIAAARIHAQIHEGLATASEQL